jgi:hypothetical protein
MRVKFKSKVCGKWDGIQMISFDVEQIVEIPGVMASKYLPRGICVELDAAGNEIKATTKSTG